MMKEVLVLTIVCALFATGQTKKNHDKKSDFEISFTNDLDGGHQIKHQISANKYEIIIGQKVITLPWPLKDGWENKIKFGMAKKGHKGKKCKGKNGKGKNCKGKKGKGKKGKGRKGRKGMRNRSLGYKSSFLPSHGPYSRHPYPLAGHPVGRVPQNPFPAPFGHQFPPVPARPPVGHQFPPVPARPPVGHQFPPVPARPPVGHQFPPVPARPPVGHQFPPVPAGPPVGHQLPPVPAGPPVEPSIGVEPSGHESGRIVGGQEVQPPHSLPWQVALARNDTIGFGIGYDVIQFCGAAIICPRYVMTAAHCTDSGWGTEVCMNQKKCIVVAGAHNIRDRSETSRTEHHIKKYIIHPKRTEWAWDYMILELSDPIKFRPEARPVMLPRPTDASLMTSGKMILVSGWGDLKNGANAGSAKLMYARVPVVAEDECFEIFGHQLGSMESVICGGFKEGGIDSCQGDSGGPVVVLNKGYVKLMAVVSAGGDCAVPGQPGVYAKMTAALDWVKKVTGNCNFKTCKRGKCVTEADLGSASRYFSR